MVDKFMMLKLLEFSKKLGESYERYDLKAVHDCILNFVVNEVAEFYLDFIKYRVISRKDTMEYNSVMQVLHLLLSSLIISSAPILCFSA